MKVSSHKRSFLHLRMDMQAKKRAAPGSGRKRGRQQADVALDESASLLRARKRPHRSFIVLGHVAQRRPADSQAFGVKPPGGNLATHLAHELARNKH